MSLLALNHLCAKGFMNAYYSPDTVTVLRGVYRGLATQADLLSGRSVSTTRHPVTSHQVGPCSAGAELTVTGRQVGPTRRPVGSVRVALP